MDYRVWRLLGDPSQKHPKHIRVFVMKQAKQEVEHPCLLGAEITRGAIPDWITLSRKGIDRISPAIG
jgi:hypothetical protein